MNEKKEEKEAAHNCRYVAMVARCNNKKLVSSNERQRQFLRKLILNVRSVLW